MCFADLGEHCKIFDTSRGWTGRIDLLAALFPRCKVIIGGAVPSSDVCKRLPAMELVSGPQIRHTRTPPARRGRRGYRMSTTLPLTQTRRNRRIVDSFPRLKRFSQIIYALMMHDIKNRFFGSGLGQIVMVLWPFAHIGILLIAYTISKRPHPYGDSLLQYSAISVYPFICFSYTSRFIAQSASSNKGFMQYPIIKPLDILLARALLEVVSTSIVAMLLIILVVGCGDNALPSNPLQAMSAIGATLFLAISFGFLNAPFSFMTPFWVLVMVMLIILAYISSGILFLPSALPEPYRTYISYNPLLQCIEWLRSAYYDDYPTDLIDKTYVLELSLVFMTLGLIFLKILRRFY